MTRSPLFDIDEVFIKLQLRDNQNDRASIWQCVNTSDATLDIKDVFEKVTGQDYMRIILEGEPGSGKTVLLKHCAVEWAKCRMKLATGEDGIDDRGIELLRKELVVYIDKDNERDTLEETIEDALKIDPEALQFFKQHPEKTFLLIDNLNDFTKENVVNEIIKRSGRKINILVSCRTNHPYLEKNMKEFNRKLRVTGFGEAAIQAYVPKFIRALLKCDGHKDSDSYEAKIEELCNFLKLKEDEHMYTIPMNCAFVCQLYIQSRITKEQLPFLTTASLYKRQQEFMLKRECTKRTATSDEADRLMKNAQPSVQGIHRMALHSLLYDQSGYSTDEVEAFGVDLGSPAMVLLQRKYDRFTWPHKCIKEHHAISAARHYSMTSELALSPECNEILELLLNSILETDQKLAKDLFEAKLILSLPDPPCQKERSSRLSINRIPSNFLCGTAVVEDHACSDINDIRPPPLLEKLETLLTRPFEVESSAMKLLRVPEIQECARKTCWFFKNLEDLEKLCEKPSDTSTYKWTRLLTEVVHPFLPNERVFSGSLLNLKQTYPKFYRGSPQQIKT